MLMGNDEQAREVILINRIEKYHNRGRNRKTENQRWKER